MSVRTLQKGELLPEELRTGYEGGQSDSQWIFVVERNDKPVAILVSAPVHIAVMLVRLVTSQEAHVNDVRSLLLHFVKTVKERGYNGYFTYLSKDTELEKTLAEIIKAADGREFETPQYLCVGAV